MGGEGNGIPSVLFLHREHGLIEAGPGENLLAREELGFNDGACLGHRERLFFIVGAVDQGQCEGAVFFCGDHIVLDGTDRTVCVVSHGGDGLSGGGHDHPVRLYKQGALVHGFKMAGLDNAVFFGIHIEHIQESGGIDAFADASRTEPGHPGIPFVVGDEHIIIQLCTQLLHPGQIFRIRSGDEGIVFLLPQSRIDIFRVSGIVVQGDRRGDIFQSLGGMISPVLAGVGTGGAQAKLRVDAQHPVGVLSDSLGVFRGTVGAFHVSVAELIAQGPEFDTIRLFKTLLSPQGAVRGLRPAVAVFDPIGAVFGSIPGGIDGDERFRADLTAQGDEVIDIDLVEVETQGMRLRFDPEIGLEGRALLPVQKTILPIVFTGEVAAGPTEQTDPQFLHFLDDILPHAPEVILGHQGYRANDQSARSREGDLQSCVVIVFGRGEGPFVRTEVAVTHSEDRARQSSATGAGQPDIYLRGRKSGGGHFEGIISALAQAKACLTEADGTGTVGADDLRLPLQEPAHVVAFMVLRKGPVIGEGVVDLFTDPVPAYGASVTVRPAHKFPVLQHLGGKTAVDAVSGMFQIVAEEQGREGLRALCIQCDIYFSVKGIVIHSVFPFILLQRIPGYLPADSSELCRSHPVWKSGSR